MTGVFEALLKAGADPEVRGPNGEDLRHEINRSDERAAFLAILERALKEREEAARTAGESKAPAASAALP